METTEVATSSEWVSHVKAHRMTWFGHWTARRTFEEHHVYAFVLRRFRRYECFGGVYTEKLSLSLLLLTVKSRLKRVAFNGGRRQCLSRRICRHSRRCHYCCCCWLITFFYGNFVVGDKAMSELSETSFNPWRKEKKNLYIYIQESLAFELWTLLK